MKKKAQRLRKETGDDSYNTRAEMDRLPFSTTLKVALTRPLIMMVTEPIVLFFSFCVYFFFLVIL